MNLLSQLRGGTRAINPLSWQAYQDMITFNGLSYPVFGSPTGEPDREGLDNSFSGYVRGAYKKNGIIFATCLVRQSVFKQARPIYRDVQTGKLFGHSELAPLERPWPGATTSSLLARMISDADLAGNSYTVRLSHEGQPRVKRLRPDWTTIVVGSELEGADAIHDPNSEVLGYMYEPGGPGSSLEPIFYMPEQVSHFAPIPDPEAHYRGMSWLTPVLDEILADQAATEHKFRFFEGNGTPTYVVTLQQPDPKKFEEWVKKFREKQEGLENAYRTLFFGAGADIKVVGADLKQLDFKVTQGGGETRIAAAGNTPPILIGLSEGLESATYSNYASARRRFADITMRDLWDDAFGSLANIVGRAPGAELSWDPRRISFLQEDEKDASEIRQQDATTIRTLVDGGFTPESAQEYVKSGDPSVLDHTGLLTVQLQPPGAGQNQNGDRSAVVVDGEGRPVRALVAPTRTDNGAAARET